MFCLNDMKCFEYRSCSASLSLNVQGLLFFASDCQKCVPMERTPNHVQETAIGLGVFNKMDIAWLVSLVSTTTNVRNVALRTVKEAVTRRVATVSCVRLVTTDVSVKNYALLTVLKNVPEMGTAHHV